MQQCKVQPNVITYRAAISAYQKVQQWAVALKLLSQMPTKSGQTWSNNPAINACERPAAVARGSGAFL